MGLGAGRWTRGSRPGVAKKCAVFLPGVSPVPRLPVVAVGHDGGAKHPADLLPQRGGLEYPSPRPEAHHPPRELHGVAQPAGRDELAVRSGVLPARGLNYARMLQDSPRTRREFSSPEAAKDVQLNPWSYHPRLRAVFPANTPAVHEQARSASCPDLRTLGLVDDRRALPVAKASYEQSRASMRADVRSSCAYPARSAPCPHRAVRHRRG